MPRRRRAHTLEEDTLFNIIKDCCGSEEPLCVGDTLPEREQHEAKFEDFVGRATVVCPQWYLEKDFPQFHCAMAELATGLWKTIRDNTGKCIFCAIEKYYARFGFHLVVPDSAVAHHSPNKTEKDNLHNAFNVRLPCTGKQLPKLLAQHFRHP